MLDREDEIINIALAKGFNYLNEGQSRMGKPNIHLKYVDLKVSRK